MRSHVQVLRHISRKRLISIEMILRAEPPKSHSSIPGISNRFYSIPYHADCSLETNQRLFSPRSESDCSPYLVPRLGISGVTPPPLAMEGIYSTGNSRHMKHKFVNEKTVSVVSTQLLTNHRFKWLAAVTQQSAVFIPIHNAQHVTKSINTKLHIYFNQHRILREVIPCIIYIYIYNYLLKYTPRIGKPNRTNTYTPIRNITSNNSVVRLTDVAHK